jgi:hypothetical protein
MDGVMTKLSPIKSLRRETIRPYRHYGRSIVISLENDIIFLRLKGTRKSLAMPITDLLDTLYRRQAAAGKAREWVFHVAMW